MNNEESKLPAERGKEPEKPHPFEVFLQEYKEPLGKVIEAWAKSIEITVQYKFRHTIAVLGTLLLIVGAVTMLTFYGKLSSDTLGFLIGAIVAYLFSFLYKFIIGEK